LAVIDSGSSPQRSGSLLFDSTNDQWIFVHQNTAGGVTSSVVLMGPPTFNSIGSETIITENRVLKAGGLEHVTASIIFDDGTNVGIGTTSLNTKLTVNGAATISGSSTIIGNLTVGRNSNSSTAARIDLTAGGNGFDSLIDFGYYDTFDANIWNVGRKGSTGAFFISNQSSGAEVNVITINTSNNVGIGTTSPTAKLHVTGSTGGVFEVDTANATTTLYVSASGNVGIGTTSPDSLVHLHATSGGDVPRLRFTNGSTGATTTDGGFVGISNSTQVDLWNFENDAIRLGTNNSVRLTILGGGTALLHVNGALSGSTANFSGNVGIGTTTPNARLTVSGSTNITGSLDVTGAFTAQTKSFKIQHQTQLGKSLVYGVLEGAEHAVYARGKLIGGSVITLPDEWTWLVDQTSITVHLTPIGSHQKLYVDSIGNNQIVVKNSSLFGSTVDCYYLVHATRKDVPPLTTVV